MKVLIAYISRTGNTKKVAQAIFEEIKAKKELKELSQVKGLEGYDLTFIGFPIEGYGPAKEAADFLEKYAAGKNIALFITHGAIEDSPDLLPWLGKCKTAATKANLKGMFNCQGELSEKIANYMLNSKDEKLIAWAKKRSLGIGQPDSVRLQNARDWSKGVIKTALK
jgi:flavodoxin